MGLSINIDYPNTGGSNKGPYKGIVPGNYEVKINKVELWEEYWKPDNGLFLVFKMETKKPSPDFEGYPIDQDNPDGPKHEGLVGNVYFSTYPYKTKYVAYKGKTVERDIAILEDLFRMCVELDCVDWLKEAQGKYPTIEEWVAAFNNDMPYKDKYLQVCIRGDQYINKEGKLKTTLSFAKYEKVDGKYINAYAKVGSKKAVVVYDESKHFKKAETEETKDFKPEESDSITDTEIDNLDNDDLPFDVDDVDTGFDI